MSPPRTSGVPLPLPRRRPLAMLSWLRRALRNPGTSGTRPALTASNLPCLRGDVRVVRDGHGVARIYAAVERDLFACLGYLQASDRFLVLDALRQLGSARLCGWIGNWRLPAQAEVLAGQRVADIDGFLRALDFEGQSQRDLAALSEPARDALEAYSEGVNAALTAMDGVYPAEYLALSAPRPWRPEDCLIAQRSSGFVVSLIPMENELVFDAVRVELGDELAQEIFPEAPWEDAPSLSGRGAATAEAPLHMPSGGSNNWAVAGSRTASGVPIVANDPHVPLIPLPTYWTHVHLRGPDYEVQGGMFPGCPILGFGHNRHMAWGCTTGFRDAFDFLRIHRLPGDPNRYRTPQGDAPIERHGEERPARFGRSLRLEWESCEHGVILPGWTHRDGADLALRYVPSDGARYLEGYLALPGATSVADHRQALEGMYQGFFDFNHVYGHRDGHIGWEFFGRLPRRPKDGLFVRDAHDPDAQWDGMLPFEEAPKILNPDCGYVCSANGVVDPEQFAAIASPVHFEPRLRHERIAAALAANPNHDVEASVALQADVGTDYAAPLRDALLPALAAFAEEDGRESRCLELFSAWDGSFPVDSVAAPLFVFTLQELGRRCFTSLLGPKLGRRFLGGRKARPRLHQLLLDPADPLRKTLVARTGRPLEEHARQAFRAAIERVVAACGSDPTRWRWGTIQRARLGGVLADVPRIGRHFVTLDAPFPGDDYTVSPSRPLPGHTRLRAFVGASSRFVCDLAKPDEAWFAHTSGPSGDPASAYFSILSQPWSRFEVFRSAFWDPEQVPDPLEDVRLPRRAHP